MPLRLSPRGAVAPLHDGRPHLADDQSLSPRTPTVLASQCMSGYYDKRLAGSSLERAYQLAPSRIQRYLRAELDFVVANLPPLSLVLDLGCGYGRTLPDLARRAAFVVGIDTSVSSLALARERLRAYPNVLLAHMEAGSLAFTENSFDAVVCIQNGISAFGTNRRVLLRESLRVLRPGGRALFSTYAERFWDDRMEWFERQAEAGLIGAIDRERSGNGTIVCADGLRLTAVVPAEFAGLIAGLDAGLETLEIDCSSRFYILQKPFPV